jgi:hypothetical protein
MPKFSASALRGNFAREGQVISDSCEQQEGVTPENLTMKLPCPAMCDVQRKDSTHK